MFNAPLLTLVANLIVIIGTIIGLYIYLCKWKATYSDNKHLLVVKLEYFKNNHLAHLQKIGACSKEDEYSIELIESIYTDPVKWKLVRTQASGTYVYYTQLSFFKPRN